MMLRKLVVLLFLVQVRGYVYSKNNYPNPHAKQGQYGQHGPHRPVRQNPHVAMPKYYQVPKGGPPSAAKYPSPHWQNRAPVTFHGRPGATPPNGPPGSAPYYGPPPKTVVPRSPQPYLHKPPFIPLTNHWKPPSPPPPPPPNFRHLPKEHVHLTPDTNYLPPVPPFPVGPASYPTSSHPPHFHDDDRGPIRTIPAPNLNPLDKPHHFSEFREGIPEISAFSNSPSSSGETSSGYQVTEDPSLHKPHSSQESYFAPDPDPNVPTLKVPPTTDPHSLPSNGKLPLDIALQQEADQSNRLTAQELFNLMNGFHPQTGVSLVPQYVAAAPAYSQLYAAPTLYMPVVSQNLDAAEQPQIAPSNFSPQLETFNYDERTRQSAHGSDSFPEASSINMEEEMEKRTSPRNNYFTQSSETQSPKTRLYGDKTGHSDTNSGENDDGIASNQVDFEPAHKTNKKAQKIQDSYTGKLGAETLASLAQAESISSEERSQEVKTRAPDSSQIDSVQTDLSEDDSEKQNEQEVMEETRPVYNPSHYQNSYHTRYSQSDFDKTNENKTEYTDHSKPVRVQEMSFSAKINAGKASKDEHNSVNEYRVEESDSSSEEHSNEKYPQHDSSLEIMEATDSESNGIKVISLETSYSSSDESQKPFNSHSQLPYGARIRAKGETS